MNHIGKSPQRLLSLKCVSTSITEETDAEWELSLPLSQIHLDLGATKNIPSRWLGSGLHERSWWYQLLQVSRYVFGTCLSRDQYTSRPRRGTLAGQHLICG